MLSKRDRARLVPGEVEEVAVVQRIFKQFVREGHGYKKIAASLNEEGIPAPRKGRWARTPRRLWQQSAVRNILLNRAYAGDSVWNRRTEGKFHRISGGRAVVRQRIGVIEKNRAEDWIIRVDTHEPLVDREVFDRAQEIIAKGRRPRRPVGRSVGSPYLLSGLVICTLCGSRVHGRRALSGRKSNGKRSTTLPQ